MLNYTEIKKKTDIVDMANGRFSPLSCNYKILTGVIFLPDLEKICSLAVSDTHPRCMHPHTMNHMTHMHTHTIEIACSISSPHCFLSDKPTHTL